MKKNIDVKKSTNFIYDVIDEDLIKGINNIVTRFPPEPNGYLHIGHAKSILLNYGIADYYHGICNFRFDDTNPSNESYEYMCSILEMVKWLGFDCTKKYFFASDYFEQFFEYAVLLIKKNKAYVCDLNVEEIKEYRGTLTRGGKNSPYRNRSVEENLNLFFKMKNGDFIDGSRVLRAKIDMNSPNINMRDPVMYRIKHCFHQRTGNKWCIYPTYDYAHCISDAIEKITHSICTLEFEDHRQLYNWFLDQINVIHKPKQIEFARLNLSYTITSKRKLQELVSNNFVNGWDDPRLPTIAGIKRRGIPSKALHRFCEKIGVTKQESIIEMNYFEECIREELNLTSPRVMAVLNPIKVIITNFPSDYVEYFNIDYFYNNKEFGSRSVPFTKEIYIEQEDFMEYPSDNFYRLSIGSEVKLRHAYVIKCHEIFHDPITGKIKEIHCTYNKDISNIKKIKGIIHWVSANKSIKAEIRLYDRLFIVDPNINKEIDFKQLLNPESLSILSNCFIEQSLISANPEDKFQFERIGYFCVDYSSTKEKFIFNRTISLKDSFHKKKISS